MKARGSFIKFAVPLCLFLAGGAARAPAGGPASRFPVKAEVIIVPSEYDSFLVPTGNIRVVFRDGHSEILTNDGFCHRPLVSRNGTVGWVRIDKARANAVDMRLGGRDVLAVRFLDGTTRGFLTNKEAPFIAEWRFVDHGDAVAISSSGHHGPLFYIRYDVKTGAVLDEVANYRPYRRLPAWAKPIANERPRK